MSECWALCKMYRPTDILKSITPIHSSSRNTVKDKCVTACWMVLVSICECLCTCGGEKCKLFASTKHFSGLRILWCKLWMGIFYYCFPFFFFFVSFLDIYAGASKLTNSIDLHFIRYANSAENGKIATDHKRWNFIEINQHCRGSCHLSFCSDAIFRPALLIPCKMILSKNSAARKRAGAWQHISLKCIHC